MAIIKSSFNFIGNIKILKHKFPKPSIDTAGFVLNKYQQLMRLPNEIRRREIAFFDEVLDRYLVGVSEYKNVTCTVGRTEVITALLNDSPTATYIQWCAVGTGAGTPAVSDTTLATELARKQFAFTTHSDTSAEMRAFFNQTEANGTLTEIGHFMDDGTAAADSGTMFNHAAISETKTSSFTLTTIFNLNANDG